jgi:hypothetical protein
MCSGDPPRHPIHHCLSIENRSLLDENVLGGSNPCVMVILQSTEIFSAVDSLLSLARYGAAQGSSLGQQHSCESSSRRLALSGMVQYSLGMLCQV